MQTIKASVRSCANKLSWCILLRLSSKEHCRGKKVRDLPYPSRFEAVWWRWKFKVHELCSSGGWHLGLNDSAFKYTAVWTKMEREQNVLHALHEFDDVQRPETKNCYQFHEFPIPLFHGLHYWFTEYCPAVWLPRISDCIKEMLFLLLVTAKLMSWTKATS